MPDRRKDELYGAVAKCRRDVIYARDLAQAVGMPSVEEDLFAISLELYRIATGVYAHERTMQLRIDLKAAEKNARSAAAKAGSPRQPRPRPGQAG